MKMKRCQIDPDEFENRMWDLDSALELIRTIQHELHDANWHVALAGGVLNRGFSEKDLDLVFVPMGPSADPCHIYLIVRRVGFFRARTREDMHFHWESKGIKDRKHVEVWWDADFKRRIDLIIWPTNESQNNESHGPDQFRNDNPITPWSPS